MIEEELFNIACKGVIDAVDDNYEPPKESGIKKGVFVTIKKKGMLRGCIGNIYPLEDLYIATYNNAIHAAVHDPRFPPLTKNELKDIDIEISVLSIPKEAKIDEIIPQKHGVIIYGMGRSATFLPQVWEELRTKEEFLSHLCLKAGLPIDYWKEKARFEIYENEMVIGPKRLALR